MDPLYPVDRVTMPGTDPVWPPHPPPSDAASAAAAMNRSDSEWSFQMFLQDVVLTTPDQRDNNNDDNHHRARAFQQSRNQSSDDVVEIEKMPPLPSNPVRAAPVAKVATGSSASACSSAPVIKADEYHAALKRQLDLACAAVAVAQSRKSSVSPEPAGSGTALPDRVPRTSFPAHVGVGPQANGLPNPLPAAPAKDWGAVEFSATNEKPKIPAVQVKSSTSGSSRDQSEDDELDGEAETTGVTGLTDDKRARRMLSNRESARRSRRRKQEHMSELEGQAAQLKVEHSSLLKNLNESNQKYTEASVNLRVLKADVETLRAKVMMAEEKVKRLTGVNAVQHFTDIPRMNLSFDSNPLANISMLPNANHMIQMPAIPAHHSPSPSPSPHHGP